MHNRLHIRAVTTALLQTKSREKQEKSKASQSSRKEKSGEEKKGRTSRWHQYLFFSRSDNIQCGRILKELVGRRFVRVTVLCLGCRDVPSIYLLVMHMGTKKVFRRAGHF